MAARILLVQFDEAWEARLAETLRQRGHSVTTHCREECVSEHLSELGHEIELVILDVSKGDDETWSIVAEIRQYRTQYGPKPMLLCVSRVYRGPRFELELERKGARVVYVR